MAQASRMAAPAAVVAARTRFKPPRIAHLGGRWCVGWQGAHLGAPSRLFSAFWRFDHWSKPLILWSY